MSVLSVYNHLKEYNMEDRIINLDLSIATVELAAKNLGCGEEEIAKTMSFQIDDKYMVIVVAGDMKIDNAKYRHEFHKKAKMVASSDVEDIIGHPVGGVCPFGLNDGVLVYLDESLKRFDYVYPAAGSIDKAIKVTIEELEKVTNYVKWIDVCKSKDL